MDEINKKLMMIDKIKPEKKFDYFDKRNFSDLAGKYLYQQYLKHFPPFDFKDDYLSIYDVLSSYYLEGMLKLSNITYGKYYTMGELNLEYLEEKSGWNILQPLNLQMEILRLISSSYQEEYKFLIPNKSLKVLVTPLSYLPVEPDQLLDILKKYIPIEQADLMIQGVSYLIIKTDNLITKRYHINKRYLIRNYPGSSLQSMYNQYLSGKMVPSIDWMKIFKQAKANNQELSTFILHQVLDNI